MNELSALIRRDLGGDDCPWFFEDTGRRQQSTVYGKQALSRHCSASTVILNSIASRSVTINVYCLSYSFSIFLL